MHIHAIFAIASLVLYVVGAVLGVLAFRPRTERYPTPFWSGMFNARNWKPIWKARDWFTRKGYVLYFTAATCVALGSVLQLVLWNM